MTFKTSLLLAATCVGIAGLSTPTQAQSVTPETMRTIADQLDDSMVITRFTYDSPGQRVEVESLGLVVNDTGLVMVPIDFVPTSLPDVYLTKFQIVLPPEGDEPERELPAVFAGRDERSGVAFIQFGNEPAEVEEDATTQPDDDDESSEEPAGDEPLPDVDWTPLTFADAAVQVGEPLVAVGRLPKEIGFQTYVLSNRVSAVLRGPLPSVLTVGDGLATVGSVVANTDGEVVGYVFEQENVSPMSAMMNTGPGASLQVITAVPPRLFVPADYLRLSLESPPSPGEPVSIPETGLRQLRGLSEDLREFYELGNMPAIEVGDIIPGSAAEQAGLQTGEIIVALNGEQLERGDTPEELPQIFYRTVRRQAVGSTLSMTILNPAGEKRDIELTLAERATQTNAASREYDETLGFSVRDVMFDDTYFRKIDPDTVGAIVEYIEETSAAATARLARGDLVRKLNQTDITGPQQFMEELAKFRESDPQGDVVLEVLRRDDTQIIRIEPPQ